MTTLDRLMNKTLYMSESQNLFRREVTPRLALVGILPLEVLEIARNAIKLPFQVAIASIKFTPWLIGKFVDIHTLDEFQQSLSSPLDILKTALKIAKLAIGVMATLTLGVLLPAKNYRVHVALGIATDERALSNKRQIEQSLQAVKQEEREALHIQVDEIVERRRGALEVSQAA